MCKSKAHHCQGSAFGFILSLDEAIAIGCLKQQRWRTPARRHTKSNDASQSQRLGEQAEQGRLVGKGSDCYCGDSSRAILTIVLSMLGDRQIFPGHRRGRDSEQLQRQIAWPIVCRGRAVRITCDQRYGHPNAARLQEVDRLLGFLLVIHNWLGNGHNHKCDPLRYNDRTSDVHIH
jgi:hypothetical protein